MRSIRIATVGTPDDYRGSFFSIIAQSLGYSIDWTNPHKADLVVYGPFANPNPKPFRWAPRALRPGIAFSQDCLAKLLGQRKTAPLRLFHSAENTRHDFCNADYAISFDLNIHSGTHFRLPYWMEMLDWSHEGITGNINPRYGPLMSISRLTSPLGNLFLRKKQECVLLSSHLREPRKTLFDAVHKVMPVTGVGAHFNQSIKNHHSSGFLKHTLLQDFAFNLCPENGMYPGYYSEKIPEAFFADCLPITWVDDNVRVDFNPEAFINLAPMAYCNFAPLAELIGSPQKLSHYASQPLLLQSPSILPFRDFIKRMFDDAIS
jgi:hypothetical protein